MLTFAPITITNSKGQGVMAKKVSRVEIYEGEPPGSYRVLGDVKVRVTSKTALSRSKSLEDVNEKLQKDASKMGANAVINVEYDRGISLTSWKALTARGTAVVAQSDERPCPYCAEPVKAAAVKCRHCGSDLPQE